MIGAYGTNLADSYYMKPSPHSTIMEFFLPGYFSRDQELPARSLGIQYIAWWNEQYAFIRPRNEKVLIETL